MTTAVQQINMKKVLIFSLFIGLFCSCKKEDLNPDYPFTIVVKTLSDSLRVANIRVEILAPVNSGAFVSFFEGWSNEKGEVSFEYDKDAVFSVRATRGVTPITFIGCTEVRLEPNTQVYKTVYIAPYDPEAEGCTYNP